MKEDIDCVLLVMNCYKYKNKADIQKKGWLKTLPDNIVYFHVLGDIDKCGSEKYVFDYKERILYVSTLDDYNSLPHKVISAFRAVNNTYNYKYIYKTDDDQILIQNNFFDSLFNHLSQLNSHYGGTPISIENHISTYHTVHDCLPKDLLLKKTTYCNGRFYLLSNEAVNNVLQKSDSIRTHVIEDHAIGYYLDDHYKQAMVMFDSKQVFNDV
jgi:hypothetical protein|uniref:Hexosyltransferase n=1 Tax=viral metagenome TaxID=1070528 RepID=A0A6C0IU10_9ZZZZ